MNKVAEELYDYIVGWLLEDDFEPDEIYVRNLLNDWIENQDYVREEDDEAIIQLAKDLGMVFTDEMA